MEVTEEVKENVPVNGGVQTASKRNGDDCDHDIDVKKPRIDIEQENKDEIVILDEKRVVLSTPTSVKAKVKVSSEERLRREKEKHERMEERRLKLEQLAAAKELKAQQKKQRDALAEQRRIEKEKLMKDKLEQKIALEEKKRLEEDLRKLKEREKEQKRKEEDEKRELKRREEEDRREKRRKEEEALELKKKRASDRFMSFFCKKERQAAQTTTPTDGPFRPFELKEGMTLAPSIRRHPLTPEEYSELLDCRAVEMTYLSTLPKSENIKKRRVLRAKLFQFHDNYRPPYYGTWQKQSKQINGRRPFAKDDRIIDYEFDSDEEWEEEPEGDECDNDQDEELESEEKCSDDEDDGFLVEHGYLSAGEGEDCEEPKANYKEDERKQRLKAKADEWNKSVLQKSVRYKKQLFPFFYGPCFRPIVENAPSFLLPAVVFSYT